MSRRPKFFDKVKTIFRRESPRAGHSPENNLLSDVPIASGPIRGGGMNDRRPDSHRGDTNVASDERPEAAEGRNNGAIPAPVRSDRERIVSGTEDMVPNDILGALDHKRQSTSMQEPSDRRDFKDVNSSERVPELRAIDPTSSDDLDHRAGEHRTGGNNQEGQLPVPNPIGRYLSESTTFDNINHSGISIGGGPVNVSNTSFNGGTHYHNPSERMRTGLELLQKRAAPSAFHNSAHRVDPPRCHPDTRVAIQKQIYDWIVLELFVRQTWIMWMHGAAGAGKSAIMQSVAELCEQGQVPLASFFFFRTDPTRNSMAPFIATLVYQLIQKIPHVRDDIYMIIESNPLIFDESLESQLQKLIIQPLLQLPELLKRYFVVMIDGLDECLERAHQIDLIQSLAAISHSRLIPVVFLVASRREPQIEAAFTCDEISDLALILPLDNSDIEQTSDDIRCFLVDNFNQIKQNHRLKQYLPINWPPDSSVDWIVSMSSGQFIFASVVIKYLSSPRANPARQLEVIHGIRLRDPSSQNPFAHLDALYQHIFSQVESIEVLEKVCEIIAYVITTDSYGHIEHIQTAFLLEPGDLDVLFTDLTAIILCEYDHHENLALKFLHASLPDFLFDKARSEQYYIDLEEYRTKLLCRLLERHPPILDPLWSGDDLEAAIDLERHRLLAIKNLFDKANASERLHSAFMNFNCKFYSMTSYEGFWLFGVHRILQCLKQLDFSDQGEAYRNVIDIFAAEYVKYWPTINKHARKDVEEYSPDLMARINQMLEQVT